MTFRAFLIIKIIFSQAHTDTHNLSTGPRFYILCVQGYVTYRYMFEESPQASQEFILRFINLPVLQLR